MADDLTVRPDAAPASVRQAPKDRAADDAKLDLERLKALVKERVGKNLDDSALEAIVQRARVKAEKAATLVVSAKTFETDRSREATTNTKQLEATQKTTGAEKARGADGLTDKDRGLIRSDPKAGPKLPVSDAKPTTPEQATQLLQRIFGSVLVDGKPVDPQEFAKTLRQLPPTPMKADPTKGAAPSTTAPTARASATLPSSTTAPSRTPMPSATLPGSTTAPSRMPMPMPKSQSGGGTTMSLRGPGTNPTTLLDTGTNTGGGLASSTSFDGMTFNWDAFFSKWMINVSSDLALWRKLMQALKHAMEKASAAGDDMQIALLKMRHTFEKVDAEVAFHSAVSNTVQATAQAPARLACGSDNSQERWKVRETDKQLEALCKGKRVLTEDELKTLSPDEQRQYHELIETRTARSGTLGMAALYQAEADRRRPGPEPSRADPKAHAEWVKNKAQYDELRGLARERAIEFRDIAASARDPMDFGAIQNRRQQLTQRASELRGELFLGDKEFGAARTTFYKAELDDAERTITATRSERDKATDPAKKKDLEVKLKLAEARKAALTTERDSSGSVSEQRASLLGQLDTEKDSPRAARLRDTVYRSGEVRDRADAIRREVRDLEVETVFYDREMAAGAPGPLAKQMRPDLDNAAREEDAAELKAGITTDSGRYRRDAVRRLSGRAAEVSARSPKADVEPAAFATAEAREDFWRGQVTAGDAFTGAFKAPSGKAEPEPAFVRDLFGDATTGRPELTKLDGELRAFCSKNGAAGRAVLSQDEVAKLSEANRNEYQAILADRQATGGEASYQALLRGERDGLPQGAAQRAYFDGEIAGSNRRLHEGLATATSTPGGMHAVLARRDALRAQVDSKDAELKKTPTGEARTRLEGERLATLREVGLLDHAFAHQAPRNEKATAAVGALKTPPAKASEPRAVAQHAAHDTAARTFAGAGKAEATKPDDAQGFRDNPTFADAADEQAYYDGTIAGGSRVHDERGKHTDRVGVLLGTAKALEPALRDFGQNLNASGFAAAVNNAVERAKSSAEQNASKAHATMQRYTSRTQGLLNQLGQLLAMPRGR